jgi:NIPSNAP
MDSDLSSYAVIEVRTYRAREGQRERLMALMRELAFPVQRALGIRLLGPFPSLEDQVSFVWLRGFPAHANRETLRRAFYEGPEWTQELEGQLMPLLDGYASVLVEDRDDLWQSWPGQVSPGQASPGQAS